jgi:hypothetical protein
MLKSIHFAIRLLATLIDGVTESMLSEQFILRDTKRQYIHSSLYAEITANSSFLSSFALYLFSFVLNQAWAVETGHGNHRGLVLTPYYLTIAPWKLRELSYKFMSIQSGWTTGCTDCKPQPISTLTHNSHNLFDRIIADANNYLRIQLRQVPLLYVGIRPRISISLQNNLLSDTQYFTHFAKFLAHWSMSIPAIGIDSELQFKILNFEEFDQCTRNFLQTRHVCHDNFDTSDHDIILQPLL